MEAERFDALTRVLSASGSRRGVARFAAGVLGGALAGRGAGASADHGCRHPGSDCAWNRQCCSRRCSKRGRCLCTRDAPCPKPTDPCQKAVCTRTGRCRIENWLTDASCAGCCADGTCEGGDSDGACGRGGAGCVACGPNARCVEGACACDDGFRRCGDTCVAQDDPAHCPQGWELVFHDEFGGDALDRSLWTTGYPWGRSRMACCGELQWYSDAEGRDGNYLVHDGTLSIVAREETVMAEGYEHPYTSGLIQTRGSFAQEHGYFEIRAQVPAGQGLWPAFWLLPADGSKPWEVDIFEILGDEPDTVHMTLHYPNAEGEPRVDKGKFGPLDGSPDFSRDYHTFAVRWDPERIVWYVDGVERHRVEEAQKIPSGPFYLIANLAVGGGWPGPPDQTTNFPARYEIDYVRVYRRV